MNFALTARHLCGLWILLVGSVYSQATMAEGACPKTPINSTLVDIRPSKSTEPYWLSRVLVQEQELARTDLSSVKMIMLGDSLVEGWAPPVQQLFYAQRNVLNLGIGGDNTQGLLWRIDRLRQTVLQPKLVLLLIGTNNIWSGRPAEEVALSVAEVVRQIHGWLPQSRILLLGLLPRGVNSADPFRLVQQKVNQLIAGCADGVSVFYTNPGMLLLDRNGTLPDNIVSDHLHPNWIGYGILSAAIEPQIRRLLDESDR